jgi:toxin-antitoxin system PIN domain toxin
MPGATLLDVNVLIALFDPDHVHHQLAHDWFADHRQNGWATCAVTETGFIRVVSHPAYGATVARPVDLVALLRTFCSSAQHQYWSAPISLRDETIFDPAMIQGHRQVTDIYLLGLAVTMKGSLATFDRSIPVSAVKGARPATLAVITAAADATAD